MPTCNICLENTRFNYDPPHRPRSCNCSYTVHEDCYNRWLAQSNMAYNCIICHKTVRDADERPTPGEAAAELGRRAWVNLTPSFAWVKWAIYIVLAAFVIRYIKEIIIVSSIVLYSYISLQTRRHGRNMFYHYARNFAFGDPIPEYRYPHANLLRQIIRFWR